MRIMCMHKADKRSEAGEPPSQKLLQGIGPLTEQMMAAGVYLSGEGLKPSATGVRLSFAGGRRTLTRGPLVGRNELLAGFCMVQTATIDEAIDWASRYAAIIGDCEIDVRPICEMWDLGFAPKPDGLETTRFMLLQKADRRSEAGEPPSADMQAAVGALVAEMSQTGVFITAEGLMPSRDAKRLTYRGGRRTVLDGPFAESKELIAGFAMMNVASLDEAITWSARFAELTGDIEIDLRPLMDCNAGAPSR